MSAFFWGKMFRFRRRSLISFINQRIFSSIKQITVTDLSEIIKDSSSSSLKSSFSSLQFVDVREREEIETMKLNDFQDKKVIYLPLSERNQWENDIKTYKILNPEAPVICLVSLFFFFTFFFCFLIVLYYSFLVSWWS